MTKTAIFVCYRTATAWWDGHLPDGTGGSEEALVEVAWRLAERGWSVRVYNNCGKARTVKSVQYLPYQLFPNASSPESPVQVAILWRAPRLCEYTIFAHKKYLWLQDATPAERLTPARLQKITKLIALSQFQRNLWPHVPDDKVFLSSNGIDSTRCLPPLPREPAKCIYTSAPDRGLECLLKLWPAIRAQVPGASLSVFYGWGLWDTVHVSDPEKQSWKRCMMQLLDQPGIATRGEHLSADELWAEYLTSSAWAYPTEWQETSCISAMKAQACGALPITTSTAALDETVQWGTKIRTDCIYSSESCQQQFVSAAVSILQNTAREAREPMIAWALQQYSWDAVVSRWVAEFES